MKMGKYILIGISIEVDKQGTISNKALVLERVNLFFSFKY